MPLGKKLSNQLHKDKLQIAFFKNNPQRDMIRMSKLTLLDKLFRPESLWSYLAVIISMKRSISTISNLKENKNTNNSSRNKSPQRLINGVKLYNFSEIESYRHINRPYLNEMKKEHIKNKLDLEKSTEMRLAYRVKKNDMFICYTRNPFMIVHKRSKSQHAIHNEDQTINNRTIIDEINQLNTKRINREIQSKDFDQARFGAQNLSLLVRRQLKNGKRLKVSQSYPHRNKSMTALELPKRLANTTEDVPILDDELEFDAIIEMKEDKYSDKRIRDMNIFQLLHDRNFFNRNLTILDKYFFSFNSMMEKFQKLKIRVYRDISRESRVNANKKPEGKLSNRFEPFSINQLNFNDIVNVAAGRSTPQSVYQQLNLDRANDNTNQSQIQEDEIAYVENTQNRSTMAENYNQSIKEVEEFLKLALTRKEIAYHRQNIYRKEEIQRKMDRVCALVKQSIYDKTLHRQLRKQILADQASFTDQNYRYPKAAHERDALVRTNKESKDKNQIIKLEQLNQVYRAVNHHDGQVRQLINKRI